MFLIKMYIYFFILVSSANTPTFTPTLSMIFNEVQDALKMLKVVWNYTKKRNKSF